LITLFIHHLTTYRYKRRLEFGPHRLILRPRESRSLRLKSHELLCKPAGGSCRDFAALFVDAVRSLGFGARIVSGYLYDADASLVGSSGSGSTHAWAEVYVPGAGWITFDPTNRSIGDANLVPVAVARHILQTVPVAGSYVGARDCFDQLEVRVAVKRSAS
jgi:transglutaminase-like putative cysteine protease